MTDARVEFSALVRHLCVNRLEYGPAQSVLRSCVDKRRGRSVFATGRGFYKINFLKVTSQKCGHPPYSFFAVMKIRITHTVTALLSESFTPPYPYR